MTVWLRATCVLLALVGAAGAAAAQITTGSVTGLVTGPAGAGQQGVTVSLSGENLIGGVKTQTTDALGGYRFDSLPPGSYTVRFAADGFKTIERTGVLLSATFNAVVSVQMEAGRAEEVITSGGSSTVDTRETLQQTVMDQNRLEGVPTGRDPWSVAKNVAGGAVGKYDVGGTQGMQQQNISAHGSDPNDKVFSIDGLCVNWPGSGGGSTMIYYDQGMFEETNYQTSAIPAEVLVGGVYLNMVTKQGGNSWRGDFKYYYANDWTQGDNSQAEPLQKWGFQFGNPIVRQYDLNASVGGALKKDRIWWFSAYRRWLVDQLTLGAKNADGTPAKDDNLIENYSGKITWQVSRDHKIAVLYNYNHKERFHRRDVPPDFVEDRATYYQNNPGYSAQGNYWGVYGNSSLRVTGGVMDGLTDYKYQKEVKPTDIRIEDTVRNTASVAAQKNNPLPNYRREFNAVYSYQMVGLGEHLFKVGGQWLKMWMNDQFRVNGDMYYIYNDGVPSRLRLFNTPTNNLSWISGGGFFAQDAWTIGRKIALNLGGRFDTLRGTIPEQRLPASTWVGERSQPETHPISQRLGVWRVGVVYDPLADGKTAIKTNFSRYAAMAGLNRVQLVNPFQFTNGERTWTDLNGDRIPQANELGAFAGFPGLVSHYADANGPNWPYSEEVTAGIERELFREFRVGVMYYHRTNRARVGFRNVAVPSSAYTPVTMSVPGPPLGPGGTITFYNLDKNYFGQQFLNNAYDNQPLKDSTYDGVDVTFVKRMSNRWQVQGAFTFGNSTGGVMADTVDLNDPNYALIFPTGFVGDQGKWAFKVSGSYEAPWRLNFSGNVMYNNGYPYQSTYTITRTAYPALTRASQTVTLSKRGDERYPNVFLADLRISRRINLGAARSVTPQIEIFNLSNAGTITRVTTQVGSSYLRPSEILAPRVVRFGVTARF